jgi:Protein of unknown function (DUF2934)
MHAADTTAAHPKTLGFSARSEFLVGTGPGFHSALERLAYALWEQRGKPLGSPEVDWFRAEDCIPQPLAPNILVSGSAGG